MGSGGEELGLLADVAEVFGVFDAHDEAIGGEGEGFVVVYVGVGAVGGLEGEGLAVYVGRNGCVAVY